MPLPSPSPSPSSSLSASAAAAAAAATAATAPAPLSSRLMSLLLVILGANFLILLVYQVSWRVSSKVVAVEEEGGGGGGGGGLFFRTVDSPRPLPAFLGQVSMPEDEQTKEEDVEEGTWPPGAVSKSDKESQRPSPVPLRSEAKVDWKPPRRPPSKNLDLSAYESLMEDRRARLEAGCNEMRRRGVPPTKNYPNVIVMKEKDVVWCPVFKAASSTWLKYLFETSSLTEPKKNELRKKHLPEQPLKLLLPISSRLKETLFKSYVQSNQDTVKSFLIVRHPFNRLVSAFRDKLERSRRPDVDKNWYYRTYGKGIVARYRKDATKRFGKDFFSQENNYGAPFAVQGHRTAALPTFWEFVQHVKAAAVNKMDEHWRPMSNYCSACTVQYEHVFLFESIDEEGEYLKHVIDPEVAEREEWVNPNPTSLKNEDLTRTYFEQLSDSDIMALYKIYEFDFKLFGYRFQFRNISLPY